MSGSLRRRSSVNRQIADKWPIPLWGLSRILSPRFPDPRTPARAFMTEDNYRRIKAHYSQSLTATKTWRYFLDSHDTWIPLTSITALYITFARESRAADPRDDE